MNLKNILIALLSFLIILYFSASFLYESKNVVFIKPFIIPLFFGIISLKKKKPFSKNYLFFILFFYMSEMSILFMNKFSFFEEIGLIFSFLCYMYLISLCYQYVRIFDIFSDIKPFELFIFGLIIAILLVLLDIIFDSQSNIFLHAIIILNSLSGIGLMLFSFLYIKEIFNNKSGFYFFGAFSLFFSDLISAFNFYFLDNFILNLIERMLHFLSFYLIYKFYIQRDIKKKTVTLFHEI